MRRSLMAAWMVLAVLSVGIAKAQTADVEAVPQVASTANGASGTDTEALAKKLANPVASLISVPIQFDSDFEIGPDDGTLTKMVIQPVIPFTLNSDWNLITRTLFPVVYQDGIVSDGGSTQFGLGNTSASQFFSPQKPTGGWIWGVGPVELIPTATNDSLGAEKWGLGPTGVALRQQGPVTYGILANHIWEVAGNDDAPDVNATLLQPFVSYTTKTATSFNIVSESTYDWTGEQWTVPINVIAAQILRVQGQILQVGVGYRYYAEAPPGGPDWGVRLIVTFIFPK